MTFLNSTLSDAGWWNNLLAEELDGSAVALVRRDATRSVDSILLSELSEAFQAFDESLASECSSGVLLTGEQIRTTRTRLGALKKFQPNDQVDRALADSAIVGFNQRNEETRDATIPTYLRPYARARLRDALRLFSESFEMQSPNFGPGAVFEGWSSIARWQRLRVEANSLGFDPYTLARVFDSVHGVQPSLYHTSRLQAVAKDWNKARLITVEPSPRTYMQQYLRSSILGALAGHPDSAVQKMAGLRADRQRDHRLLALEGSRTGMLATLDLSDASDRISTEQVYELFPADVAYHLEFCRSPSFISRDGQIPSVLHMYAGMGNATTFVVQTLLFWAMCHAVADYHRLGKRFVSVYGDDIVVDWRLADTIIQTHAFARCGWVVNTRKSFWRPETRFRESCGVQAFHGEDVTLMRIRGYQNTPKGILGCSALIKQATARGFHRLAERVWRETTIPNVRVSPPGSASVDLWWLPRTDVPIRYREDLQRIEVRLERFEPEERFAGANTTELVYGAIAEQLHNARTRTSRWNRKWEKLLRTYPVNPDGTRKCILCAMLRAPKFKGRLKVRTACQRRGRLEHHWLAANDVCALPDQFAE